jgi:hypothetical protein
MARLTTRLESSTAFTAYFVTYASGFAGLMYLTRALPLDGVVLWLPFGLPVALLAILAAAARAEEHEPERVLEHRSLLGRTFARVGPPLRTYPMVGMSMVNPLTGWMYPASAPSQVRLVFDAWWLACAVTAWIVIPRIFSAENRRPLNPRIPDH